MRKEELVKYVLLIGLVLVLSCSTVQAVGVSPPSFTIPNTVKGGEYESSIMVYNTANDEEAYELSATGPGSEWITFYRAEYPETSINKINIKGHSKARVLLKIKVADDAPSMEYRPTIFVSTIPSEATGEGGAVAQSVMKMPVTATIQVTGTQTLQGTVKSITAADTELGYPLRTTVEFQNKGNVVAKPKIAVNITKDGQLIDTSTHDETGIKPGKTDTVTVLWDTTGKEPGDYIASVDVSLGEEVLATEDLSFTILSSGTLTREGALNSVSIGGEPLIDRLIKILAQFENTGTGDTKAKFTGEVCRNGELVDVLESDEKLIAAGETANLVSYFRITIPGEYKINGLVLYEGKETEAKEVSFSVREPESGDEKPEIPGFEFLYCLIALMIISIMHGTLSKRRDKG
jgi:hypothetical protein